MLRKLPVYLLVDTSYSMRGEPIEQINRGFRELIGVFRKDPMSLEILHLSIVTYNTIAKQILPLTPLYEAKISEVKAEGRSNMGAAFELLTVCMQREIIKGSLKEGQKGDFQAIIYLLTDGAPSDAWKNRLKQLQEEFHPKIISFGTGNAKLDVLRRISGVNTIDLSQFEYGITTFIEMVSQSVVCFSKSINSGLSARPLPLPFFTHSDELF